MLAYYAFGIFFAIMGFLWLTVEQPISYAMGIASFVVAFIAFPIFDRFAKCFGQFFSVKQKILLGAGTFILPTFFAAFVESSAMAVLITFVIIICFWIMFFLINRSIVPFRYRETKTMKEKKDEYTDIAKTAVKGTKIQASLMKKDVEEKIKGQDKK